MPKTEEQRLPGLPGEEERRRIVTSAEQEIEMARKCGAAAKLKAYVGQLAVELAEKKIRVSKDTDRSPGWRAFTAQMGKRTATRWQQSWAGTARAYAESGGQEQV